MRRIDECRERLRSPGLSEEKKLSLQVEIDERKRNIEARMTPQDRQRRAWFLKQARKMKPGELTKEKVDELITKSRKRFKEPKEAR
jgi:hypothetical protein